MSNFNYYEQHDWLSNSMLKSIKGSGFALQNLEEIFRFGDLFHRSVLEPHLVCESELDYELAQGMKNTVYADPVCARLLRNPQMRIEHEFYKKVDGTKRRCKADGWLREMGLIFELKGLGVENEKQFRNSIDFFDYDMGASWYLDITGGTQELIVGVSKKKPGRLWKYLIQKGDEDYRRGREKYLSILDEFKEDERIMKCRAHY